MNKKFNSFSENFKKVDGFNIIKQYFKSGVLFFAIFQVLSQGFSKKSLEIVRNSVDNKILRKLRKKYASYILDNKDRILDDSSERNSSNKVWVLWLQGMDNAPDIVKTCYKSLVNNLSDREIVLLTEENYRDYITFPDYIQEKVNNGVITKTHMSDLLRLELLTTYGGIWIDATVFLSSDDILDYMLSSELFLFQKLKPALDGNPKRVSTWYICAKSNHPILILTKELLYLYWSEYNYMVDYFLIHDFMELSIEVYPQEWEKVIPFSSSTPHLLLLRLFDNYEEEMLDAIFYQTSIHKLTYKFSKEKQNQPDTYYQKIVKDNK